MPSRTKAVVRSRRNQKKTRVFTVVYELIPANEGKGYYAHIPALGITTDGRSLAEAKEMALDAIECHLKASRKLGHPIPDDIAAERVEVPA